MTALRPSALVLAYVLVACGPSSERHAHNAEAESSATRAALSAPEATVHFTRDWNIVQSAPLVAGGRGRFQYDAERLTECRGDLNGQPAWSITGFYQLNGGTVRTFEAGGLSPSQGTNPPVVDLPEAGELVVWFQINNRWGCSAWDSAFGANYRLKVLPQPRLEFRSDWSVQAEGLLVATANLRVDYDPVRLPICRATENGLQTWDILVYYRFDAGPVSYASVTEPIHGGGRRAISANVAVPAEAEAVELWFKNTDPTGCVAWDSSFGQNYTFNLR